MPRPILPFAEFYITNRCNLKCRGCNRYNNYDFNGHYEWNDDYIRWSEVLDIKEISILGGEPAMHPRLEIWASNLRTLWPDANIFIQSNGTCRLDKDLYWDQYRVGIGVSLHDETTVDDITAKWPQAVDNLVFHQPALIQQDDGFVLHDSDPELAFNACDVKHSHTFLNGKLYKCATMAVLPEFIKQFDVHLTDKQKELLAQFQPLDSTATPEEIAEFIATRNTQIPQCVMCPAELVWRKAYGDDSPQAEPDFS